MTFFLAQIVPSCRKGPTACILAAPSAHSELSMVRFLTPVSESANEPKHWELLVGEL